MYWRTVKIVGYLGGGKLNTFEIPNFFDRISILTQNKTFYRWSKSCNIFVTPLYGKIGVFFGVLGSYINDVNLIALNGS